MMEGIINRLRNDGISTQITIEKDVVIVDCIVMGDLKISDLRDFHRTEGKTMYEALNKMVDVIYGGK